MPSLGQYVQLAPAALAPLAYDVVVNPDAPDDRIDRKLVNIAGNSIGGRIGYALGGMSGNPYIRAAATAAGALGGGFLSDRIANLVDASGGKVEAIDLLNASLVPNSTAEPNPLAMQAVYKERIRQARMQQKEMERQKMLQYQAEMSRRQVYG